MLFTFSCSSTGLKSFVPKAGQKGFFEISESDGIKIELRQLSEQVLTERIGRINNPFISPVSFIESNKLNTFSICVVNNRGEAIVIVLKEIEMQIGGRVIYPLSSFHLAEFWRPRIEKQKEYRKWNMSQLETNIKKYNMNDREIILPGKELKKYLVFKGELPTYGKADLYIPVKNTNGSIIHIFKFSMNG